MKHNCLSSVALALVSFNSRCSYMCLNSRLVHEFHFFNSHTKWNLFFLSVMIGFACSETKHCDNYNNNNNNNGTVFSMKYVLIYITHVTYIYISHVYFFCPKIAMLCDLVSLQLVKESHFGFCCLMFFTKAEIRHNMWIVHNLSMYTCITMSVRGAMVVNVQQLNIYFASKKQR